MLEWNDTLLNRVNDFGDPHPHPRYQGWFYFTFTQFLWERFRFTFNGKFEKHEFRVGPSGTSPLGASNFYSMGVSERGAKCHQGGCTISYIIFLSQPYTVICEF